MHRFLSKSKILSLIQSGNGKCTKTTFTANHQRICVSLGDLNRSYSTETLAQPPKQLPKSSKVVICGGGAIGCSVAYHLALQGWTDIVLLEQGSLTCGTTWHSVGLIGRLRESAAETSICSYSADLYRQLEDEGFSTGWKQCGSVNIARTPDRLIAYKRALLNAERVGVKGEIISPEEVKKICPLVKTDDIEGGVWLPEDGVTSAPDVATALSNKAKTMGVKVFEKVQVEEVMTENDRVQAVKTNQGEISCEYFVNCAGQWARGLGQKCNPTVAVPLHPCEHFYIVTKPIEGTPIDRMMPVIRDYDGYVYIREWGGGILGGGFEPQGKPVFHDKIPDKFEFQLLPEDWDHFQVLLEQLLHRFPVMAEAEVKQMVNGPESFTPDGKYILGESPEVENYFVAAGMNSSGIAAAGGVGKLLAEWMVTGSPSSFVWNMDVRRFVPLHNNNKFLKERVTETLGLDARLTKWDTELAGLRTGRNIRFSPLYTRMETTAAFGQTMGYERPLYLTHKTHSGDAAEDTDMAWYYDRSNRSSTSRDESNMVWIGQAIIPDREVNYRTGRKLRTSPIYTRFEPHSPVYSQIMGYERVSYFNTLSADREGNHAVVQPYTVYRTGRMTRTSPLASTLLAQRARYEQLRGIERPMWYDTRAEDDEDCCDYYDMEINRSVFGRPDWFDKVKSEYWACREGVSLIDMSTFSKFELRSAGREVVDFLQYVCSNDVDRPIGTVIHTGMQNHNGGYENDCSIVRLDEYRYFMIGPTAQQTRAAAWLKKHKPKDGSVQLSDVTSMYTAINVIGPKAQELLQELTDSSLQKSEFAQMTCQEINVGQASGIKAMRLTHSGEDGWMLYIPSEYALHVYDSLMVEGKNYGIRNAGYYALRALRTEKFFAYWGTDLTSFTTPMECGREFRVKLDKGGFIGHEALMKQKTEGIHKKLVQFLLMDHKADEDLWPWGGEPIYRNGQYCGVTSSTAYGFTLDRHVCLGYVHNFDDSGTAQLINTDFILKNAKFEIDIAGKRFQAKAGIYPPKLASAAVIINTNTRTVKRDL